MPLNLGLNSVKWNNDLDNTIKKAVAQGKQEFNNTVDNQYNRIGRATHFLPTRGAKPLIQATLKAHTSKFVPNIVTKGLMLLTGATALKKLHETVKRSGGKKSKKSKKQNKYTKKGKKKINGVTKVIYSKKNSKKLYVKSKGRMINLKTYKKNLTKK